jgi:hypothetical protein
MRADRDGGVGPKDKPIRASHVAPAPFVPALLAAPMRQSECPVNVRIRWSARDWAFGGDLAAGMRRLSMYGPAIHQPRRGETIWRRSVRRNTLSLGIERQALKPRLLA